MLQKDRFTNGDAALLRSPSKALGRAVILLVVFAISGCNLWAPPTYDDDGHKIIHASVAWRAAIYQYPSYAALVDGNTGYFPSASGVAAVNLDNGTVKWKTNGVFNPGSNIEKISNNLYVFEAYYFPAPSAVSNGMTNARIAKMSADGKKIEMLTIGPGKGWTTRMFYLSSDGTYLYWGTDHQDGLARVIRFNPETMEKTIIYTTTDQIFAKILIHEGIAYIGHIVQEDTAPGAAGTIVALNLSNNSVLWEKTPEYANYMNEFPFMVRGDRLYDFDSRGTACYNKDTGVRIFESSNAAGGYYGGAVFDGDNAYFTSPLSGKPKVVCINKDTGEVVWSDSFFGSLGTTPYVNNGVLYVAAQNHLRLYDALTGEVLGVDYTIKSHDFQLSPTERYKDLMLVCGYDGITAVKMNYRK